MNHRAHLDALKMILAEARAQPVPEDAEIHLPQIGRSLEQAGYSRADVLSEISQLQTTLAYAQNNQFNGLKLHPRYKVERSAAGPMVPVIAVDLNDLETYINVLTRELEE